MIKRIASVPTKTSGAVAAALLAMLGGFAAGIPTAASFEKQPLTFQTTSGDHQITVEVADSDQERAKGLMFRRSLGDDQGMIFLYPRNQEITMWMRNTYIPLDMIFVREDGTIHRIEPNTEPFSESVIRSEGDVRAVIEMIGGSARRLGLKRGDKIDYPLSK